MARCSAIKANGERCTLAANGQHGRCWAHDPANKEKRSKMASHAAKAKPSKEIRDLKGRVWEVVEAVLEGSQEKGRAAVAIQGFNALRGVLELERRLRETEELEKRLEQLEAAAESGGATRRGA